MQIDLTFEESKILEKEKELILIEPMNPQPGSNYLFEQFGYLDQSDCIFIRNNQYDFLKIKSKYKVGQEIIIRQEWRYERYYYYDGINQKNVGANVSIYSDLRDEDYKENRKYKSPKTMPPELWQTARITEILEPRKAKMIGKNLTITCQLFPDNRKGMVAGPLNREQYFKDWFNKKFSEPIPVECDVCEGTGNYNEIEPYPGCCAKCGGDGISHHISYWYEKESQCPSSLKDVIYNREFKTYKYKGKDFQIIVNPWTQIAKIEKL